VLKLNGLVAVPLFAALTAVVALQVLNRLVLHLPLIWSEEVARFLFFWVVLLGAAMSVRTRRHFVIDLPMGRRAAGRTVPRLVLDLLPDVCVLGFGVFLLVQGIGYAEVGLFRTATNSEINMAVVYAAIPVFAALTIVYAGLNVLATCRTFATGERAERRPPPAV
jgi:TRAP-type C4-dicarboxylate transport system permease small subunit